VAPSPSSPDGTPFVPEETLAFQAFDIDRATLPSAQGAALPFQASSASAPTPAALEYEAEADELIGETAVVESMAEIRERIAKIEATKESERQALADQEAKEARAQSEEEERKAATAASEERRREEAQRFAAEQAAAQEKQQRQKDEAEASTKKAGLNFRRHARRGFKRDNES
jgi:hypothetical protein